MKPIKNKPDIKRLEQDLAFRLLLDKTTKSVRRRAKKHNQPIAISEFGIIYLIFPDGGKVQQ